MNNCVIVTVLVQNLQTGAQFLDRVVLHETSAPAKLSDYLLLEDRVEGAVKETHALDAGMFNTIILNYTSLLDDVAVNE